VPDNGLIPGVAPVSGTTLIMFRLFRYAEPL
jgi:hypothetical protein